MMEFEQFREVIQAGATKIADTLPLGDDWNPFAFLLTGEGQFVPALIDPRHFRSEKDKNRLAEQLLPELISGSEAKAFALLTSVWVLKIERKDSAPFSLDDVPRPSEHPDREEMLLLDIADQTRAEMWTAKITRPSWAKHPILGEWDDHSDTSWMESRFRDPALIALRGLKEK